MDQRAACRDRSAPEFLDVEVVEIGFESAAARPFAIRKPGLVLAGIVAGAAKADTCSFCPTTDDRVLSDRFREGQDSVSATP